MNFVYLASIVTAVFSAGVYLGPTLRDVVKGPPRYKFYVSVKVPEKIVTNGKVAIENNYFNIVYVNTQHTIGKMKEDIREQLYTAVGDMPMRILYEQYNLLDNSRIEDLLPDGARLQIYVNQTFF